MLPDDHSTTSPWLSATGSVVSAHCPKCEGTLARRSHRDGLAENMLSLLYVYPFRCRLCGHRFFSLQWGIRYQRVPVDHRAYPRHLAQVPVMQSGRQGAFHGKTPALSVTGCTLRASGPSGENFRWNVRLLPPSEPHPVMIDDAVVRTVRDQQIGMEFLRHAAGMATQPGQSLSLY